MANYIFEQMTDAQAAGYTTADALYFLTGSPSTVSVVVNPATGITNASLTLTNGAISHTFGADALDAETLTFFGASSSDTLEFGANSATDSVTVTGAAGAGARYYALGQNDTVTGSAASDTIFGGEGADSIVGVSAGNEADFLNGGNGADSILGGTGNDHIFGNEASSTAGAADGNDTIDGGDGRDYVNGNGGNDIISGGNGNDALYGGSGADSIVGGNTEDYLQGNKGNDTVDGGDGSDTVHGGADNDSVVGGNGDDQLFGDLGNDTITGGNGADLLTGGAGNDVFIFTAAGENPITPLTLATTAAGYGVIDVIADFVHGSDKMDIAIATVTGVDTSATTFANAKDAYTFAQTQVAANPAHVSALQVGTDTYVFYDSDGVTAGAIDSVVKLVGVTASTLTASDFI